MANTPVEFGINSVISGFGQIPLKETIQIKRKNQNEQTNQSNRSSNA